MKKTTTKKTTRATRTPSKKKSTGGHLKVGPAAHTIKRKSKAAAGASATKVKKVVKNITGKAKKASLVPATTKRKAKQVGRAVGSVLGKAIGNVERVVTRVMKSTRSAKKK